MLRRRLELHWITSVLLLGFAATPALADVKGRAYGCYADLSGYGVTAVTNCDSGWLDRRSGGSRSSYKSNVSYGDLLHIDYMESESHGDNCKGHSGSKVESGWIMRGTPCEVTWKHMESADEDTCCKPNDIDDLPSVIEGLTFGGRPVVVTGRANQTLTIPGQATLILNEVKHEAGDNDCDNDDEEHHALHLILKNGNEVILASAKFDSDDDCCNLTPTRHPSWGEVKSIYR
jgi:hypothetical protein